MRPNGKKRIGRQFLQFFQSHVGIPFESGVDRFRENKERSVHIPFSEFRRRQKINALIPVIESDQNALFGKRLFRHAVYELFHGQRPVSLLFEPVQLGAKIFSGNIKVVQRPGLDIVIHQNRRKGSTGLCRCFGGFCQRHRKKEEEAQKHAIQTPCYFQHRFA